MRRFNRNIDVGCDWAPGQRNFRGSGSRSKSITHCQQKSFDDRFTPEINHAYPQANVSSSSLAQRHDSARVIRPTIASGRYRSSTRLGFVNVKMWFLALCHHALQRAEKSRSWTQFGHSNKERRKKISYTARTTH
jgi:hypothetical protein